MVASVPLGSPGYAKSLYKLTNVLHGAERAPHEKNPRAHNNFGFLFSSNNLTSQQLLKSYRFLDCRTGFRHPPFYK